MELRTIEMSVNATEPENFCIKLTQNIGFVKMISSLVCTVLWCILHAMHSKII